MGVVQYRTGFLAQRRVSGPVPSAHALNGGSVWVP
jgi:hypothetical protein